MSPQCCHGSHLQRCWSLSQALSLPISTSGPSPYTAPSSHHSPCPPTRAPAASGTADVLLHKDPVRTGLSLLCFLPVQFVICNSRDLCREPLSPNTPSSRLLGHHISTESSKLPWIPNHKVLSFQSRCTSSCIPELLHILNCCTS